MKKFLLLVAMAFAFNTGFAQDYNWGVGIRAGGTAYGFAAKHKMDAGRAIEGILSVPYYGGFTLTGLYEKHVPVISDGFSLFYGGGAHIGTYGSEADRFRLGIDAVVGLEFKLPEVPLAFAIDYKPALDIISDVDIHFIDFGFSIRYVF